MTVLSLRKSPKEIIRLLKAEIKAAGGQPGFYVNAHHDYRIEEDFDRVAYGLENDTRQNLVTEEAVLHVEPRVEQNYWVLSINAYKELGPQMMAHENALSGAPLALDEFGSAFIEPGTYKVNVRLTLSTPKAHSHFDRWWKGLKVCHPRSSKRVNIVSRRKSHWRGARSCA